METVHILRHLMLGRGDSSEDMSAISKTVHELGRTTPYSTGECAEACLRLLEPDSKKRLLPFGVARDALPGLIGVTFTTAQPLNMVAHGFRDFILNRQADK